MAAVCRATGLGQHTLRVWERRFDFPRPLRLPSGHRRYPGDQVERLRLIARAIAGGHRASAVVPLEVDALQGLLAAHARIEAGSDAFAERLAALVRSFDRAGINTEVQRAVAELGTRAFLHERVVPLVESIGEGWVAGTLDIRHEHFVSEILIETLRALRTPLESSTPGRPIVLTTLPGEEHAVGMQMAALTIALAGRRAIVLGAQTPPAEIVEAARTLHPIAVGLTVTASKASAETARLLNGLADALPAGVRLWLGGAGSRVLTGLAKDVVRMPTLDHLTRALAALPAR
jgi:methanogenic corrinoid protein MtbC1